METLWSMDTLWSKIDTKGSLESSREDETEIVFKWVKLRVPF
jgi:hypothetical protein